MGSRGLKSLRTKIKMSVKNIKTLGLTLVFLFLCGYLAAEENDKITELDDFLKNMGLIEFNKSDWKRMRIEKEKGTFKVTEEIEEPAEEGEVVRELKRAAPKKGGLIDVIELPYESELSITGRQDIKLLLDYKKYYNREEDEDYTESLEPKMEQRTQVKIKGTVGERIKVDVDYDSESEKKQDISIVYKGKPDDIVQEAAFGDVTLSLPGSEFVSYRGSKKSLFGGKVSGQYKKLKFMAIGSQSKGIPEVKKFTGKSTFESKDINDYSYMRRKYYKIYDSTATVLPVSGEEIYIDDKDLSNNIPVIPGIDYNMTVELEGGTTYYGFFNKQVPGRDYYINYREGIITFKKTIGDNDIIAVYYKHEGGEVGATYKKVIKNEDETLNNELRNYYNLGATKISRGVEGRDFIVKILDKDRNEITTIGDIYQKIEMDYDAGILRFNDEEFFNTYLGNPDIYNNIINPNTDHEHIIYVEYFHRKKTYSLRFNMIEGSERVLLNGRQLEKDQDYMIEYGSGFITFFKEDEITEDSQIEISYEYAPWGAAAKKNLLGLWGEFKPSDKFSVKGTLISDGAPRPISAPDLGSIPSSMLIYDVNSSLKLESDKFPLKTTISGEYAHSSQNPNVFGKAIVDNMEGIKLIDSVSMHEDSWRIARNPDNSVVSSSSTFTWDSESQSEFLGNISTTVATISKLDRVQVLKIDYDMGSDSEQASMVYSISKSGADYTRKASLECYIQGNYGGEVLRFRLGNIDEDADNDGNLDTEDFGLSRSVPGDAGENDNILSEKEDVGWEFEGWDDVYNVEDRLDTEDIDNDGILDYDLNDGGVLVTTVTWGAEVGEDVKVGEDDGWRKVSFHLNVSTSTAWTNIKHLRLTLTGVSGKGSIKIAELKIAGNRWEKGVTVSTGTGSITVDAINNEDDPEYESFTDENTKITIDGEEKTVRTWYYNEMYQDYNVMPGQLIREQSLSLEYTLIEPGDTAYTLSKLNNGDFTGHESIGFFVYRKSDSDAGGTFFMQFGSENAYYEYSINLNWEGWKYIEIDMVDVKNELKLKPREFRVTEGTGTVVGAPSFLSISQIKMGIINNKGAPISGELWINEIHLSGSREREGRAARLTVNTGVPKWFSLSGTYKGKEGDFSTITAPSTRQESEDVSVNGRFDRLKFLPVNGSFKRSKITTPVESFIPGDVKTFVSSYEEGVVTRINRNGGASFIVPKLPRVNYNYSSSNNWYSSDMKEEKANSHRIDGSYALPIRFFPIPLFKLHKIFNLLPESISYSYGRSDRETLGESITDFSERNRNYSLNIKTEFIKKIPFNVSYSFKSLEEEKNLKDRELRLQEESVNLDTSVKVFPWFQPTAKYSIRNKEDYRIPTDGSLTKYKNISRTSSGEVSLRLKAASVIKAIPLVGRIKLFSNLVSDLNVNGKYKFNDGDIHEDVDKNYDFFTTTGNINIPRFDPVRWIEDEEIVHNEDIKNGRLKSYGMQDTINLDGSWTPLSFINLGKGLSLITGARLRGKYSVLRNQRQDEGTLSEKNNTTRSIQATVKNIEEFPLVKWFPVLGKGIKSAQTIINYSSKSNETRDISISTSTTISIDSRCKLWVFDLWLKYVNTTSGTRQSGILSGQGNNDTYNGNINFRLFGNWQFIIKGSYNKVRQYTGEKDEDNPTLNLKQDDELFNLGLDMNTSIQPSKIGLALPGTARIRGTLFNVRISTSPFLRTESKINTTLSFLTMTVEYDQGTNLLVSFGLGFKLYDCATDRNDYFSFNGWGKLTFQF